MNNIFDQFIDDEEILNPVGKAAEEYIDKNGNPMEIKGDANEDKDKDKEPKVKRRLDKMSNAKVNWKYKSYRINRINENLMNITEVRSVTFIAKAEGFNEDEETEVAIKESWMGLLGFLIGCVHEQYKEKYLEVLSNYGVFNNSIQLRVYQPTYLDKDIEDGLNIYKIEHLGILIEYRNNLSDLRSSIRKAISILKIRENNVVINLFNPNYILSEEKKNNRRKVKSKTNENVFDLDLTYDIEETKDELESDNLIKLNNIIDSIDKSINIVQLGVDGEFDPVDSNEHAASYILAYLIIMYEDRAISVIKNNSLKDEIGVTEDNSEYFEIMKTTKLPNSNLYFYYNGNSKKLIKYLYKICEEIGVDQSSIEFSYYLI